MPNWHATSDVCEASHCVRTKNWKSLFTCWWLMITKSAEIFFFYNTLNWMTNLKWPLCWNLVLGIAVNSAPAFSFDFTTSYGDSLMRLCTLQCFITGLSAVLYHVSMAINHFRGLGSPNILSQHHHRRQVELIEKKLWKRRKKNGTQHLQSLTEDIGEKIEYRLSNLNLK